MEKFKSLSWCIKLQMECGMLRLGILTILEINCETGSSQELNYNF